MPPSSPYTILLSGGQQPHRQLRRALPHYSLWSMKSQVFKSTFEDVVKEKARSLEVQETVRQEHLALESPHD